MLVILEQLNWGVGPTGYNRLKDIITSDVAVVNEKFMRRGDVAIVVLDLARDN